MSFGDVFAGWQEAAGEHYKNLLQMDYQNKQDLAQQYAKFADDERYAPEQRQEFARRALQIHTLEPGKKLPKEWENMTIRVTAPNQPQQPPTPQTGPLPQSLGGGAQGQAAPPIAPPSNTRPLEQPMSPEEMVGRQRPMMEEQARIAGVTSEAQRQAQLEYETELDKRKRVERIKEGQSLGLTGVQLAQYAQGSGSIAMRPFNFPSALKGDAVANMFHEAGQPDIDVSTGKAHDPNQWYKVRHTGAQLISEPEAETFGAPRWGQTTDGQWVQVQQNQHGISKITNNVGLKPPQAVPETSIMKGVRFEKRPDGSVVEVPYTETTTRTRGGQAGTVAPPTAPPGQSTPVPGGLSGPREVLPPTGDLSPSGQKQMSEVQPTISQFDDLISKFDKLKDNNTPGYFTLNRALYAAGIAPDEKELVGQIANLELAKIQGSMPFASKSRAFQYIRQIQQHQPNVWVDSPKNIYQKLLTVRQNFSRMVAAISKDEVRGAKPGQGQALLNPTDVEFYKRLANGDTKQAIALAKKDGFTGMLAPSQ